MPDEPKEKRKGSLLPDGGDGPTQLGQQSYVRRRPGAYWASPGVASVRAPAPSAVSSYTAAETVQAEAATPATTRNDASSSSSRPPSTDAVVTLEAEPVLSILVDATPFRPDPSARRRRLTMIALLVAVAVVAAAATAGVMVGGRAFRSKPQPSPSTTTTAPTTNQTLCEQDTKALEACLDTGNVTVCAECLVKYGAWSTVRTCEESQSVTCRIAAACPECGNCQEEHVALANCQNAGRCEAFVFPNVAPSSSSPPAAAPSAVSATPVPSWALDEQCEGVASAFANCSGTSGSIGEAACLSCVKGHVPTYIESCEESELYTCSAMEACPECGNCEAEFAAMANCGNQGVCDTVTCPAAAPTPSSTSSNGPIVAPPSTPQ